MVKTSSRPLAAEEAAKIRDMLLRAGAPDEGDLALMIAALLEEFYLRKVIIEHIADSVGQVDEDPAEMASRIRREFGRRPRNLGTCQ